MSYVMLHAPWDERAERYLAPAMAGDPTADLDWLRDHVAAGEAMHIAVEFEGQRVGSVVVRFERQPCARECVIVAAGGEVLRRRRHAGHLLPAIEAMAAGVGADMIRAHSSRMGLWRVLGEHGWHETERVYRKVLV